MVHDITHFGGRVKRRCRHDQPNFGLMKETQDGQVFVTSIPHMMSFIDNGRKVSNPE